MNIVMLDKTFIKNKIRMLSENVNILEQILKDDVENIKADILKLPAVERYFQRAVDLMVDMNTHIINEGDFGTVDDLQSTFKLLGDFNILEESFARKVSPIVGVRNMLVHRYEKLDKDMFLNNLKRNFGDFKTYLIQIDDYLKKN
ncbi:MAG: DUF86 domain-containing protein [Candidatus Vogelbacteria bacterium]|nr:DUF86 domain-containing protein [Candidatus Vogelbacteria bacterium]